MLGSTRAPGPGEAAQGGSGNILGIPPHISLGLAHIYQTHLCPPWGQGYDRPVMDENVYEPLDLGEMVDGCICAYTISQAIPTSKLYSTQKRRGRPGIFGHAW